MSAFICGGCVGSGVANVVYVDELSRCVSDGDVGLCVDPESFVVKITTRLVDIHRSQGCDGHMRFVG